MIWITREYPKLSKVQVDCFIKAKVNDRTLVKCNSQLPSLRPGKDALQRLLTWSIVMIHISKMQVGVSDRNDTFGE